VGLRSGEQVFLLHSLWALEENKIPPPALSFVVHPAGDMSHVLSWPPMAGCVNATKAQRRASSTRSVDPLPLRNKQKSLEAICTSSGRSGNSGNGKFEYLKMLLEIDLKKVIPEILDSGSGFS